MKVSFFHDARIIQDDSFNYHSIGFPYSIWERYLRVFDELIISTRMGNVTEVEKEIDKGYRLSSGDKVTFSSISKYTSMKDFLKDYRGIKSQIRESLLKSDGAIVRLPSIIGIIACREAAKLNKEVIVETVGCSWDAMWNYGSIFSKIIAGPMYLLQRKYTKKAAFVIYITNNFLQRRYPTKGVSMDGVANVMISATDSKVIEERKPRLRKLKSGKVKVGLIGSLDVNYKGHNTAIKAISYLKNNNIDADLSFVGGGDVTRWKNLAKKYGVTDNVHFEGTFAAGEDIYNWLDSIDVYIQPSLAEGHGRALVEAVSRGCISFGSNIGGIPDTLQKDYLFPPKDYKRIAELIIKAKNNYGFAKNNIEMNIKNIVNFEHDGIEKKRDSILLQYKSNIE